MNPILRTLMLLPGMDELCSRCSDYSALRLLDAEVDVLFEKLISFENARLLKIAFDEKLQQEDLDAFINDWDIEKNGAEKALFVAYAVKKRPDLNFGAYNGPRLKGLLSYYRFQNLRLISHFSKIVGKLNENGIFPLIFKGGAMKYLRPELPRAMGDIDVLVDSIYSYNKSKTLVQNLGYDFVQAPHSIDVCLPKESSIGVLDIHRYFSFCDGANGVFVKRLFKRARLTNIFSCQVFLPTQEDLFFVCLNNITRNLMDRSCSQGVLLAFFDSYYLVHSKSDFNWESVIDNVFVSKSEVKSYIAFKFLDKIIPGILPQQLWQNKRFIKKVVEDVQMLQFYVKYVHEVKNICKRLKFKKAISSWQNFKYYVKNKGKHLFVKTVLKSKLIVSFFVHKKG